jgi:hypothetical protein
MDAAQSARAELLALDSRRKAAEEEMELLTQALQSDGVGMSGGLIDADGFPIADTEKILRVRQSRHRLACLRVGVFCWAVTPCSMLADGPRCHAAGAGGQAGCAAPKQRVE